ncbi:8857_t:CDS:2, partial [Cetraspora pellucida]
LYLKSLENIMNNEQGSRKKKAQLLYDKYKKSLSRANKPVLGHRQSLSLSDVQETRPDHQIAKNWESERRANKIGSGPSINIYNSTFSGNDQRIGTIYNESNSKRTLKR